MTDNAELIAEARDFVQMGSGINVMEADRLIEDLSRELEAAEQRAAENAAVVEKLRAYAESIPRTRDRDVNPGLSNRSWLTAQDVLGILASAPADALREMKADVWDEGDAARRMYVENRRAGRNVTMPRNPYREEQDRG